jgi:hypothetical protein
MFGRISQIFTVVTIEFGAIEIEYRQKLGFLARVQQMEAAGNYPEGRMQDT